MKGSMRVGFVLSLLLACLCDASAGIAAQDAPGLSVSGGTRVRLKVYTHSRTILGTVVSWGRDTLVLNQAGSAGEGDTIALPLVSLREVRVLQSPTFWSHAAATKVTFLGVGYIASGEAALDEDLDEPRPVLVIGSEDGLAGVDVLDGSTIWNREDLRKINSAEFDFLGNGYATVTRAGAIQLLDLETGETRWDTRELELPGVRGFLWGPRPDDLLLYMDVEEAPSTLAMVDVETGEVRWRQNGLFQEAPEVFERKGVSYLLGHQPPVMDTDSTFVLYISPDGPMKLNLETGSLIWRAEHLAGRDVPLSRRGYSGILDRDGVLYIPSEEGLVALNAADGTPIWEATHLERPVSWMGWTRHGLLVKGTDWHRVKERWYQSGYPDVLDPATGKSRWSKPFGKLKYASNFVPQEDTLFVAADRDLYGIDLRDGSHRRIAHFKLHKGDVAPTALYPSEDRFIVHSGRNLLRFDREGALLTHLVYPTPGLSLGERLRGTAGIGDGTVYRPAARRGGTFVYVYTDEPDRMEREGFSIVKIDAFEGRERARVWIDDRNPTYVIEPSTGTVIWMRDEKEIAALRFVDLTSLAYAARNGRSEIVRTLLDMGADPDWPDAGGHTALHLAARYGRTDVVKLLVERGADVNAAAEGWAPWMFAARNGHAEIVALLRDAGSDYDEGAALLLEGWWLASEGRIAEALVRYSAVDTMNVDSVLQVSAWGWLCWDGSVWGQAADVLPFCDRAVEGTSESDERRVEYHQARAIARAVTGDIAGALTDQEAAIAYAEGGEDDLEEDRLRWAAALREGRNPFVPELLEGWRER